MEAALIFISEITAAITAGYCFQLKSKVTSELLYVMEEWLLEGCTGGMVIGLPRLGKTCAMRWVLNKLAKSFGFPIPWTEFPIRKSKSLQDEDTFFRQLLSHIKHRSWNTGNASFKRDVFERWVFAQARKNKLRTFILFIDEAQFLTLDQLTWLYNTQVALAQVKNNGCRLMIVLNGSLRLYDLLDKVREANLPEIIGRFMTDEFPFRGLLSQSELKEVLQQFDTQEYPEGSGRTLSSWFLEHTGHPPKLEDIAECFWTGFDRVWRDAKQDGDLELPMWCVFRAMSKLLRLSNASAENQVITPEMVAAAVGRSGLTQILAARASGLEEEEDDAEAEAV
jgi:hypothetical protein